jgi:hypothetical protein
MNELYRLNRKSASAVQTSADPVCADREMFSSAEWRKGLGPTDSLVLDCSGYRQGTAALRMTAQLSSPVAIAKADATAAKRLLGAIVELVLEPAMVGAIRATAGGIDRTMIAKPRRQ